MFPDNIIKDGKLFKAYQRAIAESGYVSMFYLKFLFVGCPGSGKTTTLHRLVDMYKNLQDEKAKKHPQSSTNVAKVNEYTCDTVTLKDGGHDLAFSKFELVSECDDQSKKGIGPLLEAFLKWTSSSKTIATPIQPHNSYQFDHGSNSSIESSDNGHPLADTESSVSSTLESVDAATSLTFSMSSADSKMVKNQTNSEFKNIEDAIQKLERIISDTEQRELKTLLIELSMGLVNLVDVGGQPIYLHLLPTLTIGQALYLVFFPLHKQLKNSYPVELWKDGEKVHLLKNDTYCPMDIIFQILSSIDCYGRCMPNWTSEQMTLESRALLIGTFKDYLIDDASKDGQSLDTKLSQINTELYTNMEETNFLKTVKSILNNIESCDSDLLARNCGNYFISLDNNKGDGQDLGVLKQKIEKLMINHFKEQPIPVSWLMLRMVLHLMDKPVVSRKECYRIGSHFNMPNKDVDAAIDFFKQIVGNVIYFEVPSMNDKIICKPQIIFDCIYEWIINPLFLSDEKPSQRMKLFQDQGEFYSSDIVGKNEEGFGGQELLEILHYVGAISPMNDSQSTRVNLELITEPDTHKMAQSTDSDTFPSTNVGLPGKYIMPTMLPYANSDELKPFYAITQQSCPIMITFYNTCGYTPFGIFCDLIMYLTQEDQHRQSGTIVWKLCTNIEGKKFRARNRFTFLIDECFSMMIISHPQYLEIQVCRIQSCTSKLSLREICVHVRKNVTFALERVITKRLQMYNKHCPGSYSITNTDLPFSLAFKCTSCTIRKPHLAIVEEVTCESFIKCRCVKDSLSRVLNQSQQYWMVSELPYILINYTVGSCSPSYI